MKRFLIMGVALALVICTAAIAAEKETAKEAGTPDAAKILDGLKSSLDDVDSYKVVFTYKKPATEEEEEDFRVCEFWFMKDDYRRLEVVDGNDAGSKVSYNPDKSTKKVAAKASYMPFPITLKKDDKRLSGFFESDWQSDIDDIEELAEGAELSYEGEEKIEGRAAHKIIILPKEKELDKVILWIGKEDSLLLAYKNYAGGKLVDEKTWSKIRLGAGLESQDFKP